MAASDFFSVQVPDAGNPLKPWGIARLAVGAVYLLAGGVTATTLLPESRELLAGIGYGGPTLTALLDGVRAVIAGALAFRGVKMLSDGIGAVTRHVIPATAPADLEQAEAEGALARRELGAFRAGGASHRGVLAKWFPSQLPLLTTRMKGIAESGLAEVARAGRVALLLAGGFALLAAFPSLRQALLAGHQPSVPVAFLVVYGIAAALHAWCTMRALPSQTPRAEVREFRCTARGGGDPSQLSHGLQQELAAIRADEGQPNRAHETGFTMQRGAVHDAGTFSGRLFVETQPRLVPTPAAPAARALLAAGAAVQLLALGWWLGAPEAPAMLVTGVNASIATAVLYTAQLVAAALLGAIGTRMVASGGELLRGFRFESLAVLFDVRGAFTRAHLRVGKGVHDSIESDNLVVRSEVYLAGHCAALLTECRELTGPRRVVGMIADDRAARLELLVQRFLWRFERQPSMIAAADLRDGGLLEIVQANLGVEAQRAVARGRTDGMASVERVPAQATLPRGTPAVSQPPTDVSRT